MSTRQAAVGSGDDALEPSAHAEPQAMSAEQEAAAAATAAAAFAKGVDSVTAAVLEDRDSRATASAAPEAAAPSTSSAAASSAVHASEKKEKQKLDKVKRAQERLQVKFHVACYIDTTRRR